MSTPAHLLLCTCASDECVEGCRPVVVQYAAPVPRPNKNRLHPAAVGWPFSI